jgi:Xaa-Pro aminopeptidase
MLDSFYKTRLALFQKNIEPEQAWLLANSNDILYLTGFASLVAEEREALLIVTQSNAYLIHAAFSPVTKIEGITYFQGVTPSKMETHFKMSIQHEPKPLTHLLLDEENLKVFELRAVESFATKSSVILKAANLAPLQMQRMKKDSQELEYLTKAGACAQKAWHDFKSYLKPGITEDQARQKLEQLLLHHGSQRPAFPTIIAFGPNSALPHHQPTDAELKKNTAVLIDFGATIQNYRSDMTRTVWIGNKQNQKFQEIKKIVTNAYQAALAALPGATALEVDTAARSVIRDANYGELFIHTTGHGVGLDIHEQPSLNWTNSQRIEPGFAITIEPGIYLKGEFGYRYENTILITESNAKEVTKYV